MTQREIAEALGMTLGKTHYSIKALIDAGLVRVERFAQSEKKLGYLYVLTPSGLAERIKLAARLLAKTVPSMRRLRSGHRSVKQKVRRYYVWAGQ